MMAFVKYHQGIFIAERFGIDRGAIVSGHQHRRVVMRTTSQESNRRVRESGEQVRVPLVHEVQRWHHNQCAAARGLHGELGQVSFTGPGREYDYTQAPGGNPGSQRLTLMRVWGHLQGWYEGKRTELPRTVDQRGALSGQGFHEAPIVQRGDAKTLDAVVPGRIVNPGFPRRWGMQDQRAPVKGERGRASHRT